jgi:hypothetical protein
MGAKSEIGRLADFSKRPLTGIIAGGRVASQGCKEEINMTIVVESAD